jgi:hypothetical protein
MKPLDPDLESLLRDAAEMLPGDEVKAIEIARFAKEVVLRILDEG